MKDRRFDIKQPDKRVNWIPAIKIDWTCLEYATISLSNRAGTLIISPNLEIYHFVRRHIFETIYRHTTNSVFFLWTKLHLPPPSLTLTDT